ncbi:V-type ATP synthase subunit F [Clostridium rectalis]|uniref:V-type ATP synthase subunit F n=1 Tax=Clostridium rectalis TaxID=2040295 RepID=UPI000F641EA2|nr:V-type ATP synthase subunit F [Clostridium rectalis]
MKAYLISDNIDTLVGLRVSGINGIVVHSKEEVLKNLDIILKDKDIGTIILTEKIGALIKDEIREIKLSKYFPLVVEIPDRHGSIKKDDSILRYVREAIGLKI